MNDGDVFRFQYNEVERKKAAEGWAGILDHCFDGQLVWHAERGFFHDTYWGFDVHDNSGVRFTLEEAERKGALTFVCNMNEVERIDERLYPQYADGDAFNLSHQHGCHKLYAIRRGAKKSLEKQLAILETRTEKAKRDADSVVHYAFHEIERSQQLAARLKAGEDVPL